MSSIQGKVVIIPGGATMIGAAVGRAFRREGARVVIADLDADAGATLARELGDGALFVKTDIRRDDDVTALVERAVATFGRVDFLVNVVTTYSLSDGLDADRDEWLNSFNVSVIGPIMLLKAALPHMKAAGGGAIVNFGSISASVAQAGRWVYPVAKGAILQLTRNEALDLASHNIRVNTVSPGWTWSNVIAQLSGGDRARADRVAADFHALGRLGEPEEIADACVFLCSDKASFITGANLPVDGGYMAMGPEQGVAQIPRLMTPLLRRESGGRNET